MNSNSHTTKNSFLEIQPTLETLKQQDGMVGEMAKLAFSKNGALLFLCCFALLLLKLLEDTKKGKVGRAYWAKNKEIKNAQKQALKLIKTPQVSKAALYIGLPNDKHSKPLYVPEINRGIAVVGAPGTGKTYSAINPLLISAIQQDFPIVLYDFKYPEQAKIAVYAERMGYDVHIFAPGFAESEVCNPLDFLENQADGENARQLATVINRNFKILESKNEDGFFGPSGDQLTEAILMLTKGTKYPDILMATQILCLPHLVPRLQAATLDPWVRISFGQLFSSGKSEKTVAGIAATAALMFTRFMKAKTLGCFMGHTTLPLDLKPKQMIVFGIDRNRRDVVSPLLCSILQMIISRNIAKRRNEPLICCLDELPTIFLPSLTNFLNESRSEGFVGLLGFQNLSQLEKIYGKESAKAIFGGCATKFLFNPAEEESAKIFSEMLGDEDIKYFQKSKSHNSGKTSHSTSEQTKTRKLISKDMILRFGKGKCLFINPHYSNSEDSFVPMKKKIKVPKAILQILDEECQSGWQKFQEKKIKASPLRTPNTNHVKKRQEEAEQLFPEPKKPQQAGETPLVFDAVENLV